MNYEKGFNKEKMALKYGVYVHPQRGFEGYAVIADIYANIWMCEGSGDKIIYTPMKTDNIYTARIILALKTSKSVVADSFIKRHILFYNDGSFAFTINAKDAEEILKQEFFYKEELVEYCINLGYSLDPHSEDYSHELRWFIEE